MLLYLFSLCWLFILFLVFFLIKIEGVMNKLVYYFFGQMSIVTYLVELPHYSVCIQQILLNCTEKLNVLHIHVNV